MKAQQSRAVQSTSLRACSPSYCLCCRLVVLATVASCLASLVSSLKIKLFFAHFFTVQCAMHLVRIAFGFAPLCIMVGIAM